MGSQDSQSQRRPTEPSCWSFLMICGKHGKNLTIIMAYQVCKHTKTGTIMAARQQIQLLEEEAMEPLLKELMQELNALRM